MVRLSTLWLFFGVQTISGNGLACDTREVYPHFSRFRHSQHIIICLMIGYPMIIREGIPWNSRVIAAFSRRSILCNFITFSCNGIEHCSIPKDSHSENNVVILKKFTPIIPLQDKMKVGLPNHVRTLLVPQYHKILQW